MTDPALPLVLAVARALADGRRVLLAGDAFEALQLLAAADVRELVVVSNQVEAVETAGETAGGAPLRLRPDWAERQSSKDLVVDLDGGADPEAVQRLLKKKGLYVAPMAGAALEALPHKLEVRARRFGALAVGETAATTVALGGAGAEGPSVWIGGTSELPVLPGVVCTIPPEAPGVPAQEVQEIRRAAADLERALDEARAAHQGVLAERDEARVAAERAAAEQDALRVAAEALEPTRKALTDAEAELEAVRAELAERRVNDKRVELVRSHFDETRRAMNEELERLRARLREIDEPAADLEALGRVRDAWRTAYARVAEALAGAVGALPPPLSAEDPTQVDAWLERVAERQAALAATRTTTEAAARELAERARGAERRARELAEALAAAEAARTDPVPGPVVVEAAEAGALRARIAHLEAALEAERALRREQQGELDRVRRAADASVAEAAALRARVDEARRDAAAARLSRAATHDEVERLRAELGLRDARVGDLEAMLAEHARMTRLLASALDEAERARETSEGERRLADQNLRLLRAEIERRHLEGAPASA